MLNVAPETLGETTIVPTNSFIVNLSIAERF